MFVNIVHYRSLFPPAAAAHRLQCVVQADFLIAFCRLLCISDCKRLFAVTSIASLFLFRCLCCFAFRRVLRMLRVIVEWHFVDHGVRHLLAPVVYAFVMCFTFFLLRLQLYEIINERYIALVNDLHREILLNSYSSYCLLEILMRLHTLHGAAGFKLLRGLEIIIEGGKK